MPAKICNAVCERCGECVEVCPADAIKNFQVDAGRCIECGNCAAVCDAGAIVLTRVKSKLEKR